jgi:hypothetical protein
MKESAKAITPLSADASRLGHGRRRPRPVWRREVQGPMRPMAVVVIDELSKDVLQMRLVDDQKPVETLGASGSNEALGHSVRLRRANRCADDLDAVASKDRIETGRERVVAIADEKTNRVRAFREHPRELARLLRHPQTTGMERAAGEVDAAAPQFEEEEH